jgi:hypothetical protein
MATRRPHRIVTIYHRALDLLKERSSGACTNAVDTESSMWSTRCSSKVQQPQRTELNAIDPHRPADLRQRPYCPSMARRRSTAATAAANGSSRTALRRLQSPYINALTCMNGLY